MDAKCSLYQIQFLNKITPIIKLNKDDNYKLYQSLLIKEFAVGNLKHVKIIINNYSKYGDVTQLINISIIKNACASNNYDLAKHILSISTDIYWTDALYGAGLSGNKHTVNLVIREAIKHNIKLDVVMEHLLAGTFYNGHLSIVKSIDTPLFWEMIIRQPYTDIKLVIKDWPKLSSLAFSGGHYDIIEYIASVHFWAESDCILTYACESGKTYIVRYAMDYYKDHNWEMSDFGKRFPAIEGHPIYWACKSGNNDVVDLILELKCGNYDQGLFGALSGGHMDIIDRMLNLNAVCWEGSLNRIWECNNIDVIKSLDERWSFDDMWEDASKNYIKNIKSSAVLKYLVENTPNAVKYKNEYITAACVIGDVKLISWLQLLFT